MLIYRYEPPEDKRIDLLKQKKGWLSLPSSFNDPFDCALGIFDNSLKTIFSENSIKEAVDLLYQRKTKPYSSWLIDDEILSQIRSWADPYNFTLLDYNNKPHLAYLVEKKIQSFGVMCFSEEKINPLMWSHYADSHKGFCVEYKYDPWGLLKDHHGFAVFPVIYSNLLPKFNLTELLFTPLEITYRLLATKSIYWAYEKEHRLICFDPQNEPGRSFYLPKGMTINSIICGAKSDSETKKKISNVADFLDVKYEEMEIDKENYRLKCRE